MNWSEALEILQWLTIAVLWLCCARLRRRVEFLEHAGLRQTIQMSSLITVLERMRQDNP